jgi:hypothetical protein
MRNALAPTLAVFAILAFLAPSSADAKRKHRDVFEVTRIDAKVKAPDEMLAAVRSALASAIEENPQLLAQVGANAPNPRTAPKKFKAYLKRNRMSAFKVTVEITEYESSSEPSERGPGTLLTVRVALRMFGETNPDRVMAFTGEGSAGLKLALGKVVRDRDRTYANEEAAKESVKGAIEMSLTKLGPKGRKKNKKPAKKGRKNK